jgi:hypothetical protein
MGTVYNKVSNGGTLPKAVLWGFYRARDASISLLEYVFSNKAFKAHNDFDTDIGPYFKTVKSSSGTTLAVYAVQSGTYGYMIGHDTSISSYTEKKCNAGALIWSTKDTGAMEPLIICK